MLDATLRGLQTILDVTAEEEPRGRAARPEDFVDTHFLDRLAAGQLQSWERQYPPQP